MTRSRREFLGWSAAVGAGVLRPRPLASLLNAAADQPGRQTPGPTVFPKSAPPAATLWAIKAENLDPAQRFTLACLQGLVNRERPRLYLAYDRLDVLWLDWLRERGDVREVRWVGPNDVYEKYLGLARGLVVTDPRVPASINVATMLASLQGWLPVTPQSRPGFPGLKVALDLGEKAWKKNVEAYRWFFAAHGDKMSRRVCAHYDPAQHELRDYFVQFQVPMVWISHPDDAKKSPAASSGEETRFAHEFFAALPPNIPCMGWWDNGQGDEAGCGENGPYSGMDVISQHAKFEVCTAFDGYGRGVGNLSVHSGTSATFRQKPTPPVPPLAGDKVYYTYTRTDGDGLNFYRQVYRDLWDQPDHGKVPVGWQLGPTASDLAPDIIDYFYKHATPADVFVNALTGIGYIRENCYLDRIPEGQREAVWRQYMDLSTHYFQQMDLSLLTTFEAFDLMSDQNLARFARLPGLKAIYRNYHRFKDTTAENATREVDGVPVFRAILGEGYPLTNPREIKRAAGGRPRPRPPGTPAPPPPPPPPAPAPPRFGPRGVLAGGGGGVLGGGPGAGAPPRGPLDLPGVG